MNRVQLWAADLDDADLDSERLSSYLDSNERHRAEQFVREQDRLRFVACRGLLREILAAVLQKPAGQIAIAMGPWGKPHLPDHPDWRFNLSHSQNQALYAVAWRREVGIDIQTVRPDLNFIALANQVLSPPEIACLENTPGEASFFNLWTRKEALLKADGRGVFLSPFSLDISGETPRQWNGQSWQPLEGWRIQSLGISDQCAAAVAVQGADWELEWHALEKT